ncbi:hypothetical protein BC827DRAFT_1250821 [Russula dissimulans]|nr:hypothetical protein BC827DRAFT_1250821 [Russula dissimulans]
MSLSLLTLVTHLKTRTPALLAEIKQASSSSLGTCTSNGANSSFLKTIQWPILRHSLYLYGSPYSSFFSQSSSTFSPFAHASPPTLTPPTHSS